MEINFTLMYSTVVSLDICHRIYRLKYFEFDLRNGNGCSKYENYFILFTKNKWSEINPNLIIFKMNYFISDHNTCRI